MIGYVVGSASLFVVAGCLYRYAKWPYNALTKLGISVDKGGKYFVGHLLKEVKYDHIGIFDMDMFKEHGEIFGIVEFDTPLIITKDPELLKEVIFNNSQSFTGRRNLSLVRKCARTLVENIRKAPEGHNLIDVQNMCSAFALDVICSTAFGVQKRNDFVDAMVRAHLEDLEKQSDGERKGLSDDEILAQTLTFLLAGYDTTSKALSFFLHCMATHQEAEEKVYQEIISKIGNEDLTYDNMHKLEYLEMCFSESLRIYPPVFRFDRRATADVKMGNMTIQKGTCVVAPVWALHHDPCLWPDPEKFDPERFSKDAISKRSQCIFMPFGAGPRNCIGMRMAQMTVKTAVVEIFRKFRVVPCEKTEDPIQLKKYCLFLQAENGIHVSFEKR